MNVQRSPKIEIGAKLLYDGGIYTVEGLDGSTIRLRSSRGKLMVITVRELVAASDFEVLDNDGERDERTLDTAGLDNLPARARRKAEEMRLHLNEAITGYPSGDPDLPDQQPPKPEYDPALATARERMKTKAAEIGVSKSTLWELKRRYEESGLYGLVDKRLLRTQTAADRLDPRLRDAILRVLDDLANESNTTYQRIFRKAKAILDKEANSDEEPVKIPSRATLYRAMEQLVKGLGTMGSAKTRRGIGNRPKNTYRRFKVSRPGEVVLIDSTSLDVFAIDPLTFRWVAVELTLALDLYTRSILAFRFTPKGTGRVDAALLLADIIVPKRMYPGWPDTARWAYHGVPETVIFDIFGVSDAASVPVVRPETVVVDHGLIFESETFRSACKALGITVQSARPYAPTDKSHIERAFLTIRQSLLENLPSYKGPDVWSRGKRVEDKAAYFIEEIEAIFAEWVVRYYQNNPHEGLRMPGAPEHKVSPNDMYEYGLAAAGFLCVPPSPDIYYQLLPIAWRKLGHDGVRVRGLRYDGDALNRYRNQDSSYGGVHGGNWPLRYDPRDYSRVFFQDPHDEEWHELEWVDAPPNVRPFNDTLLAHAKEKLLAGNEKSRAYSSQELAEVLEEMFDRVDRGKLVDPKERKAMVRALIQGSQAGQDRGGPSQDRSFPSTEDFSGDKASEAPDPDTGDADPWNVDPSKIEPFEVWGDANREEPLDDVEYDGKEFD